MRLGGSPFLVAGTMQGTGLSEHLDPPNNAAHEGNRGATRHLARITHADAD